MKRAMATQRTCGAVAEGARQRPDGCPRAEVAQAEGQGRRGPERQGENALGREGA